MADEIYSLSIDVITQPAEESIKRISQITGESVNSIANSFDKITKGWDSKKIDLYAAAMAQAAQKAKDLSKVSDDLLNISKTTGVPADQLKKMWNNAESELKKYEEAQNKLYQGHYAQLDKELAQKKRNEIESERLITKEYEAYTAAQTKKKAQDDAAEQRRKNKVINDQKKRNSESQAAMGTISMPATIVGAATLGALTLAVKKNAEFEQSMAKVGAKADATSAQLVQLKNAALDMTKYGFRVDQIVEAQDTLASMGFDAKKITESLKAITVSARASGSDLNNVADLIAKVLNVYQLSANKASNVADILAMADIKSAANLQTMYYAMNYAAAPAKTLGISLEELSGTIMELSNAGFRAETIGTSLKTGFIDLAKNADKLKKVGIDIKDTNGNMKSLADIIDILGKKMNGLSGIDKLKVLSTFIPKTAAAAWINLIAQGGGQLREYTSMLKDVDGASEKLANTIQDNLMGDIQKLQGGFDKLTISGGGTLAPSLRILTQGLNGVVDALNSTDPATQTFVTGTMAGVGSAALFIGATTGIISTLGQLNIAFKALGFAGFLNPLTIGIGVVGLLTGAIMSHLVAQKQLRESIFNTGKSEIELNQKFQDNAATMVTNTGRAGDLLNAFTRLAQSHANQREKLAGLIKMQDALGSQFPEIANKMNPWIDKYRQGQITVGQLTSKLKEFIVTAALASRTKIAFENLKNAEKQRDAVSNKMDIPSGFGLGVDYVKKFAKNAIQHPFRENIATSFNDLMSDRKKLQDGADKKYKAALDRYKKESNPDNLKALKETYKFLTETGTPKDDTYSGRHQTIKEAGLQGLMPKEHVKKGKKPKKGKAPLTEYEKEINAYDTAVSNASNSALDNGDELTNQQKLEMFEKFVKRENAIQNNHLNQKATYDKKLAELKKAAARSRVADAMIGFDTKTVNDSDRVKYEKYMKLTQGLIDDKSLPMLKSQMDKITKTRKEMLLKANEEDIKISEDSLKEKINLHQLSNNEIYAQEIILVDKKIGLYKDIDLKKFNDAEKEKTEIIKKEQDRQQKLTIEQIDRKKALDLAALETDKQNLQFEYDMGRINDVEKLEALKLQLDKEYNLETKNIKDILDFKRKEIQANNPNASSERIEALLSETTEYEKAQKDQQTLDVKYNKESLDATHQMIEEKSKDWRNFTGSMKSSFTSGLSDMIQGNSTFATAFDKMLQDLNKSFSDMLAKMIIEWTLAQAKMVFTGGKKTNDVTGTVLGQNNGGLMGGLSSFFGMGAKSTNGAGSGFVNINNTKSVSPNGAVAGATGNVSATLKQTQNGWTGMLNVMKQHQGVFIAGSLLSWGLLAKGSSGSWAMMSAAAYSAIRFMFVAMKNAKAKEAWMDAFSAASGAWSNAMTTYPFPLNLAIGATSAASAFAFPAAKAAAITAMSFDVGTMSVPQDMLAQIHKDEVIVPAKFSDRARSVLEGKTSTSQQQQNPTIHYKPSYNISMIDTSGADDFIDKHIDATTKALKGVLKTSNYNRAAVR